MVARETHRLHHRLGTRHVERDSVETGDFAQPLHVERYGRMIAAEHRSERARARRAPFDARLVEVVAEYVDAVRSGQVVERVAVEIGHHHAGRRLHERAAFQVFPHVAAELERHAISAGKLKIRNVLRRLRGQRGGFRKAFAVERGEPQEPGAALRGDFVRRVVAAKKVRLVVLVVRDQCREPACHARMPRQGRMLGLRQFEARHESGQRRDGGHCAQRIQRHSFVHLPPPTFIYRNKFANR